MLKQKGRDTRHFAKYISIEDIRVLVLVRSGFGYCKGARSALEEIMAKMGPNDRAVRRCSPKVRLKHKGNGGGGF